MIFVSRADFVQQLRDLQRRFAHDTEALHADADRVLLAALRKGGETAGMEWLAEVAATFEAIEKEHGGFLYA